MNESRHPIDDLFRDGLDQHSVEPPMHVWERIDQTRTPVYKLMNNFKQNSRWYLSVAAGLVLMSSAAIIFLSDAPWQRDMAEGTGTFAPQSHTESNRVQPTAPETESYPGTSLVEQDDALKSKVNPSINEQAEPGTAPSDDNIPVRSGTPSTPNNNNGGGITLPVTHEFGNEAPMVDVPKYKENSETEAPKEANTATPNGILPAKEGTPEATPIDPTKEMAVEPELAPEPEKQTDAPALVPKEPSRWSLELLGSYDFMNRRIQHADPAYVKARKDAEKVGAAYTFQLRAGYRLNDLFTLRSGLSFSQSHEKLNFTRTESRTEIVERQETGYILDPINGPTPISYMVQDTLHHSSSTTITSNNTYTYIDIPVLLNYTFITSDKWNLGVSAGPMFNLAFKQKGRILGPVNNEIIDLNSSSNPFRSYAGVNLMVNVSASYQLSKQFDFLFEPGLRYGMSSLTNKGFGMTQKYSSINLFTGIRYRF